MRQIILAVALFIASTCTMTINAQTKTPLGLKLNGNLTDAG